MRFRIFIFCQINEIAAKVYKRGFTDKYPIVVLVG